VAVAGTSLYLNGDGSRASETVWGGSGGGSSLYETEPAYQKSVQATGKRTTPDVSFDADPATGVWNADPNMPANNPWQTAGGTSLSAPSWASLIALANQGRVIDDETTLGSSGSGSAQEALYSVPQNAFYKIDTNRYNVVTGLGSPVANLLVQDLIAYRGNASAKLAALKAPTHPGASFHAGFQSIVRDVQLPSELWNYGEPAQPAPIMLASALTVSPKAKPGDAPAATAGGSPSGSNASHLAALNADYRKAIDKVMSEIADGSMDDVLLKEPANLFGRRAPG
jgi:hypothetical protein